MLSNNDYGGGYVHEMSRKLTESHEKSRNLTKNHGISRKRTESVKMQNLYENLLKSIKICNEI